MGAGRAKNRGRSVLAALRSSEKASTAPAEEDGGRRGHGAMEGSSGAQTTTTYSEWIGKLSDYFKHRSGEICHNL